MKSRETDLDTRYARFGSEALTEFELWALSAATMVMPSGNPGAKAYLTYVSGTDGYAVELRDWGMMVAREIAASLYLGKGGLRRRAYVEGYRTAWGAAATSDGLSLALLGYAAKGIEDRCKALGCGKQGYQRIRDFVGGAFVNAIAEFRHALRWAHREIRDRVFESRWESITGLKWDESDWSGTIGRERHYFPQFAPGCGQLHMLEGSDERALRDRLDPETRYPAIRVSGCWNEATAREMRSAPVKIIYKALPRNLRAATDE